MPSKLLLTVYKTFIYTGAEQNFAEGGQGLDIFSGNLVFFFNI